MYLLQYKIPVIWWEHIVQSILSDDNKMIIHGNFDDLWFGLPLHGMFR